MTHTIDEPSAVLAAASACLMTVPTSNPPNAFMATRTRVAACTGKLVVLLLGFALRRAELAVAY